MASWISNPQVAQWLEKTRMPTASVDHYLQETTKSVIKAALRNRYDVTTWVDQTNTPLLIQTIASMFNAGYQYQRQFGEDIAGYAGQENWGQRLVSMANSLLADLRDGVTELDDMDAFVLFTGKPIFWPTDLTGTSDPNFDTKFSMGMTF